MTKVNAFAAYQTNTPLKAFQLERREPGPQDVQIDILFCGVCHSDLHFTNGDWGRVESPIVPGHEIVGRVERIGSAVKKYAVGDMVGVGCLADSCRKCESCEEGFEQFCTVDKVFTYGSPDKKHGGITQGGYSTKYVVDENFAVRIPKGMSPERAAPLLCAGITTYSPLRHWKVGKDSRVAVAGLGGLGHMGVKIASAMGAHVTVLSTSERKQKDSLALGADEFLVTSDRAKMYAQRNSFDLILNTISAAHDYNLYLDLLRRDGTMVLVGLPGAQPVSAFSLVNNRRSLAGSPIGGIAETQEMLDFCAKHELAADVEVIPMQKINDAFARLVKGDVKYRFVIDLQSLK
ncbi:MAG: NAD(P)-dependent alcohol dehydrogenase [Bdellovibrionia bacterium]